MRSVGYNGFLDPTGDFHPNLPDHHWENAKALLLSIYNHQYTGENPAKASSSELVDSSPIDILLNRGWVRIQDFGTLYFTINGVKNHTKRVIETFLVEHQVDPLTRISIFDDALFTWWDGDTEKLYDLDFSEMRSTKLLRAKYDEQYN